MEALLDMGKITIELNDVIESKLRTFVRDNYLKPHGQLSTVIEKAIQEFVSRQSVLDFVDQIGQGRHVLLVYQDKEMARTVELRFLLNGLRKGLDVFYFLTSGEEITSELVNNQLAEYASQLGVSYNQKNVHILSLAYPPMHSKKMAKEAVRIVTAGIGSLSPAYAVVHFYSPSGGEEARRAELEIETEFQASFSGFPGSLLCNIPIGEVNPAIISRWVADEIMRHQDVICCLEGKHLVYKLD